MDILIIAATGFEIQPSIRKLKKMGATVVISGVGAAPSVYVITKAIQKYKPKLIIQAGIAGCFNRKYALGDVLLVSKDNFGDIGVVEHKEWKSIFDLNLIPSHQKPFKEGWLVNPHRKLIANTGLETVSATTVNEISTNKSRISLFIKQGFVLESMEGAALHYVALVEKIPFLQIRAISNYVGVRDKSKWKIAEAITNLNTELMRVIDGQ
ncbi:futalosine hydrolase [Niabella ginsengisoli]|uniref:Futalosine hydrolase n=1 Tax=Niabella ginsengisoli TaxID=522298 RepID=A0ABS9SJC3_9BACT|nr:futalosine hydrolase [Niabella ginsengisoli]MCH5598477.1 futalosine hydrolase [Niabella ginsengisoli]